MPTVPEITLAPTNIGNSDVLITYIWVLFTG